MSIDKVIELALEYSRKLPWRPASPYGQLMLDEPSVQEAFRLCYEELRKVREEKK